MIWGLIFLILTSPPSQPALIFVTRIPFCSHPAGRKSPPPPSTTGMRSLEVQVPADEEVKCTWVEDGNEDSISARGSPPGANPASRETASCHKNHPATAPTKKSSCWVVLVAACCLSCWLGWHLGVILLH